MWILRRLFLFEIMETYILILLYAIKTVWTDILGTTFVGNAKLCNLEHSSMTAVIEPELTMGMLYFVRTTE